MKITIFPIFAILLLFTACEKDNLSDLDNQAATERGAKVDVCHNGNIININVNALPAHQNHGDAVDFDGDGYFDKENSCSEGIDCDDTNAAINPDTEEICDDGIDNNCNGEIDEGCSLVCSESCCWCDLLDGANLDEACVLYADEGALGVISFVGADGEVDLLIVTTQFGGLCGNLADGSGSTFIGVEAAAECLLFVADLAMTAGLPECEDDIFGFADKEGELGQLLLNRATK